MQLPKYGIERINNNTEKILLPDNSLPWIDGPVELNAAHVILEGEIPILYASAVGLNSSVEKVARKVSAEQSQNAEQGLFKALPNLLNGELSPNIDRVSANFVDIEMFKVSKVGRNAARLYFAIFGTASEPLIVKLGISNHDQQVALQGIIGNVKRRQKADGKSR